MDPFRFRSLLPGPREWGVGLWLIFSVVWILSAIPIAATPLSWTPVPVGAAALLRRTGYRWRVVVILVAPIAALDLVVGIAVGASAAPAQAVPWTLVGTAICSVIPLMLLLGFSDHLVAFMPDRLVGSGTAITIGGNRLFADVAVCSEFLQSLKAGQIGSMEAAVFAASRADNARREASRGGLWADAWEARAAWLGALASNLRGSPSDEDIEARNHLARLAEAARNACVAAAREAMRDS